MGELISGKEALIALANGEEVECKNDVTGMDWSDAIGLLVKSFFDPTHMWEFRLKPSTVTLNGVEIPAPFEPKDKDVIFYVSDDSKGGFHESIWNKRWIEYPAVLGVWRTEEEIKQVIAALRSVFNVK